jgi:chromosome partitioning protein
LSLLSFAEAADRVNVSKDTIRRRVRDGTLKEYREGTKLRVRDVDVDRLFAMVPHPDPVPTGPCRVIAVANQKGGVGKTSTCANLAAALSKKGLRVLAVDCDPQGNLTQAFGPDPDSLDKTLYSVLVERLPLDKAILSPVLDQPSLALVPANLELAAADLQLGNAVARESRLRQVLEPHLTLYDYVFIDCPPALGLLTLNALSAATEVIVPVEMGVFSLRGVAKLMDTITEVRSINPGLSRIRALSNRSDHTNLSTDVQAELKRSFGDDLFQTTIRRSVKVGEAQAAHLPITVYRPNDMAARDYMALAEEVQRGA